VVRRIYPALLSASSAFICGFSFFDSEQTTLAVTKDMNFFTLLLIALGLAMDCFAVAIASGVAIKRLHLRHAIRIATAFGLFQALMPVIGWLAGLSLRQLLGGIDHWIAFGLLTLIGGKMIYEAFRLDKATEPPVELSGIRLMVLAVATSIDALAVGVTFAFLQVAIIGPVLLIGAVAFALSLAGALVGNYIGHFFEKKIEVAGGLVLIVIGAKILLQHLQ
jgi:putative Mn2+ efflux pump MntP